MDPKTSGTEPSGTEPSEEVPSKEGPGGPPAEERASPSEQEPGTKSEVDTASPPTDESSKKEPEASLSETDLQTKNAMQIIEDEKKILQQTLQNSDPISEVWTQRPS